MTSPALANRASSHLRSTRAKQRQELRDASPQEFVRALIDPPPELASFKLIHLFGGVQKRGCSRPIPLYGVTKIEDTLRSLRRKGHEWASSDVRLRSLSRSQRRLLVAAVLSHAPRGWRSW